MDGVGGTCSGVSVAVDPPSPIDLEFDENCQLFVTEIPVGTVTITIEVDGITGAITLDDVTEGEVVEIEVQAGVGAVVVAEGTEPTLYTRVVNEISMLRISTQAQGSAGSF